VWSDAQADTDSLDNARIFRQFGATLKRLDSAECPQAPADHYLKSTAMATLRMRRRGVPSARPARAGFSPVTPPCARPNLVLLPRNVL
jgi:hypothetical protein